MPLPFAPGPPEDGPLEVNVFIWSYFKVDSELELWSLRANRPLGGITFLGLKSFIDEKSSSCLDSSISSLIS